MEFLSSAQTQIAAATLRLASGRVALDRDATGAADALATAALERDRVLPPGDEPLVEQVERLEQGQAGREIVEP